jgi:hypothetical protein
MPQYVREVKEKFDYAKVFARELKMGRAYHSPYMAAVGAVYDDLLARALVILSKHDLRWRRPRLAIISLVMG